MAAARDELGARHKHELKRLRVQRWKVPEGKEAEAVARLSRHPAVEWAQPNHLVYALPAEPAVVPVLPRLSAQALPNDPLLSQQWGLTRIGAFDAWNITQGSPSVVVAVIDSGLDFSHPDRPANLVPGYDFVDDDAIPDDQFGHGTHVTGIIAAATDNGQGVAGVAPGVSIMELRVLSSSGVGNEYDVGRALEFVTDPGHPARIVNMSLGGNTNDAFMQQAVADASAQGALLVASAGNAPSLSPPVYPAAYPGVLAIGAIDSSDSVASFSIRSSYTFLAAPGVSIYSTYRGGSYGYLSGTSMAAPHVAGVAALMLAANPALGADGIARGLKETARDIAPAGWDDGTGWGCVDALAAVNRAYQEFQAMDHLYFPLVGKGG